MEELKKQGINPIVYDIQLIKGLKTIKETIKESYLSEIEKVKEMKEFKNIFDTELLKFEKDFYPLTNEKYDNLKNKISEIMIKTGSDLTVRHILKTMEYMKFTQELLFEKNIKKSIEEYNKLSSNINENEKIDFMKSKLIKIFGENFKYRIGKSTSLNFQGDTLIENIDNKTIEELFKSIILNDQNLKNEYYDQNLDLLRYQNIVGAGLHDIGKIVVGQELLDGAIKFVDFSIRNKYILNNHDEFGKFFISDEFVEVKKMVSGHHGKENLKESNQISMITMVDMFDALVSPRSYKSGVLLENNEENLQKNMKALQEILEKFDKYKDIEINGIKISNIRKNIEENIKKIIINDENNGEKNYKEYLGNIILFTEMKNLIYKKTLETENIDENEQELFKEIFNDIKNLKLIDDVPNIILRNPDINSEIFEIFIENYDLYKIKFLENFKLNLEQDIQYFKEKEKEIIKEINNAKMEEIGKVISSHLNQNDVKELQDILQHFSNLNKSEFEKLDDNLKYVLEFLEENKFYKTHNFTNLDKKNDTNEEKFDKDASNLSNKLKENQLFSKIMEIVNFKHGNMKINDLVENIETKEYLQPSKLYLKLKEYSVNSIAMEENLKVSLTNLELIETNLKLDNLKLIDTDKKEHFTTILKARERIEIELNEFMNNQPKTSQYMVMNF